jgi:hypothetical protein
MVVMLLKRFWVVARRQFLVYNQRLSHLQGLTLDPDVGTNKCPRKVGYTPKIDAGLQPKNC